MKKKIGIAAAAVILALALLAGILLGRSQENASSPQVYTGFAMSTVITQTAYGKKAAEAEIELQRRLQAFENRFSMFLAQSDIARINAAAGKSPVSVSGETMGLLKRALELSKTSQGAFQLTIAPVTQLWGITTDHPRVPGADEIARALALVDDDDLILNEEEGTAYLRREGQAVDLGGVAKGTACELARETYEEYGIDSAWLSIGGNIYVRGEKPGGTPFRIGFRDPYQTENSYLASFQMKDRVLAVSGGYERYFEENGVRYHHIIDPATGYPAESDIVSAGVFAQEGTLADFMSTTLFVWGSGRTLEYMRRPDACDVIFLTDTGTLYVSESLRDSFELEETHADMPVVFVERREAA
ncbi:MAG: FAD:protein FMN transferase [Oscillospiraceae bacterium]|nr:FAD:protein FMN transferase [Oscillospiraceae bacterium]